MKPSRFPSLLPLCASSYNPPAGGTWALDKNDFTQTGAIYNLSSFSYEEKDVTFHFNGSDNKIARIVFSDGLYLGVIGYSPVFIIKKISANSMNVAISATTVDQYWDKPSVFLHFTFVPK